MPVCYLPLLKLFMIGHIYTLHKICLYRHKGATFEPARLHVFAYPNHSLHGKLKKHIKPDNTVISLATDNLALTCSILTDSNKLRLLDLNDASLRFTKLTLNLFMIIIDIDSGAKETATICSYTCTYYKPFAGLYYGHC